MPTLTQRAERLRQHAAEQDYPFQVLPGHPVYELAHESWSAHDDARKSLVFTYGLLVERCHALETTPADAVESRGHITQDINLLAWRLLHHWTARPAGLLTAIDPAWTEEAAPAGGAA